MGFLKLPDFDKMDEFLYEPQNVKNGTRLNSYDVASVVHDTTGL